MAANGIRIERELKKPINISEWPNDNELDEWHSINSLSFVIFAL